MMLSLYGGGGRRALHSFPTRRSSDLEFDARSRLAPPVSLGAAHVMAVAVGSLQPGKRIDRFVKALALARPPDRKSTRLNSSHVSISYAVFCLKKKNTLVLIPDRHSPR